ncbi:MAG: hypothetical protein ACRD3T_20435, partial [Terriglobia bacterium]
RLTQKWEFGKLDFHRQIFDKSFIFNKVKFGKKGILYFSIFFLFFAILRAPPVSPPRPGGVALRPLHFQQQPRFALNLTVNFIWRIHLATAGTPMLRLRGERF